MYWSSKLDSSRTIVLDYSLRKVSFDRKINSPTFRMSRIVFGERDFRSFCQKSNKKMIKV